MNSIFKRAAVALKLILGRYEGASFSTRRTSINTSLQDARIDISRASRETLQGKARYFERNSGLFNRLCDVFEQYTVGTGLVATPKSSDAEYNARAASNWAMWCKFPDLTSRQSFGTLLSLISRTWFVDGEVFIHMTRGSSGRPRLQLIEAHRVKTPPQHLSRENISIVDGIEIDQLGRPVAYWVESGYGSNAIFTPISADSIIHHFEPQRAGQYRGLPFITPVINDLHDLHDLQSYEMIGAKDFAEMSYVFETDTGEIEVEAARRELRNESNITGSGEAVVEQRIRKVSDAAGGRVIGIRKDKEAITQLKNERPSAATQGFWDYLTSKICAGVGISKQLVFPWSMQGTVVRLDVDTMAAFFRSRSSVIASTVERVYIYVSGVGIVEELVRTRTLPPKDWASVDIRLPRSVVVDVGRNSAAVLAELKSGATSFARIYGDLGLDPAIELRNRAKEAADIMAMSQEFGVPPEMISDIAAKSLGSPSQQSTQATA